MSKPISVIIPCFNHGGYLREAIASLETCDETLFEVVIINDGSTDPETIEILHEFSKAYTVIDQENAGLGAARNSGIRAAMGRYILPLDADNIVYPNYLTKGIELLDGDETLGVVYGKRKYFGAEDMFQHAQAATFDASRLVVENYIDACAVIRKTALEECAYFATDIPTQGLEDWDLWLTMVERGWGLHFVDEFMYGYRLRNDSMSAEWMRSETTEGAREYITRKHAGLVSKVLVDQYRELVQRRSWVPNTIRAAVRKIRTIPKSG